MLLESPVAKLRTDWLTLLQSFGVSSTAAQTVFENLRTAYTSPKRHYHTLEHIKQVLQTVEQLQIYAQNLALVKLAVWFHDKVGGRSVRAPANTAVQRIDGRSLLRLGSLQPLHFAVRLILSL